MFIKIYEKDYKEASDDKALYHYINTDDICSVTPMVDAVRGDDGTFRFKDLNCCCVDLVTGDAYETRISASDFVEKYLKASAGDIDLTCDATNAQELSRINEELNAENVELYEANRYYKSFLERRALLADFYKFRLTRKNREKERAKKKDELPFS